MDFPWFPCGDERELHYSGSAIKKQEGRPSNVAETHLNDRPPQRREKTDVTHRPDRHRRALPFAGRFRTGDDGRTAQRLHGRLREILQGRGSRRRTHHRLSRQESDKITPACKKVLTAAEKK
jgi:hypothetical protein